MKVGLSRIRVKKVVDMEMVMVVGSTDANGDSEGGVM